ncbi:MAG TPA: hypothetical protein DIS66_01335 [Candidatus Omnitrophica bacterium]|nr:hypothetical protein [Candidatus Omnitrophota bacterium]
MFKDKDIIVFDIETQNTFQETGKSRAEAFKKLRVSIVGVYEYLTDSYKVYEEKELMELDKRFQKADLLLGFNSAGFDLPVLSNYFFTPVDRFPHLDLMTEIEKSRGHRASLDSVAKPTLKAKKSGSGLDAIMYWKEGRMDELKKYCLEDVRITKEVFEYGCREGKILFTSTWDFKTYEIAVNWKQDAEALMKKASSAPQDFPSSLF